MCTHHDLLTYACLDEHWYSMLNWSEHCARWRWWERRRRSLGREAPGPHARVRAPRRPCAAALEIKCNHRVPTSKAEGTCAGKSIVRQCDGQRTYLRL
eukprot:6173692-Pleurochrysis_carterae.AAC.1